MYTASADLLIPQGFLSSNRTEYNKGACRLVTRLRECGEKVKDEDVMYTILLG